MSYLANPAKGKVVRGGGNLEKKLPPAGFETFSLYTPWNDEVLQFKVSHQKHNENGKITEIPALTYF